MEQVVSLISTVGFPIVCVIFLWRFVNTTMKDFSTMVQDFRVTLQENTLVLEKVSQKLDALNDK